MIFVSIDDNEQAHLRLLLDSLFGPDNFVETIVVEISTTSGPKVVNAQQGTIVKNVEFVHVYRKTPRFDEVAHTPLYDGIAAWDTHYSLWLEDDFQITSLAAHLNDHPDIGEDIERLRLRGKSGFSISDMDSLLSSSEAAREFVLQNVGRIASTDRAPVACEGMDAPFGGYVRVQAGGRDYLLTSLSKGQLRQVVPLSLNYRMSDDYRSRFGRTVIRGDLWKGFHQDMGNVAKEGDVAFSNGKKPIRLIKQLVRWANNSPDAVILDYFGGSGTTVHAVMEMNAADNGRRQAILVTNNEVSAETAANLKKGGFMPGNAEWEDEGVFRKVTWPRLKTAITGARDDGSPVSPGFDENLDVFELTYQDRDLVQLGRKFEEIAPLLWLKAGARGPIINRIDLVSGWALPQGAAYGILFDISAMKDFCAEVNAHAHEMTRVFVMTDHESEFQSVLQKLPIRSGILDATQLYGDYVEMFRFNGRR